MSANLKGNGFGDFQCCQNNAHFMILMTQTVRITQK